MSLSASLSALSPKFTRVLLGYFLYKSDISCTNQISKTTNSDLRILNPFPCIYPDQNFKPLHNQKQRVQKRKFRLTS